ncbi:MAG: hypothetical protein ACI9N9_001441 [Enterobacterales bacterium]|jgi:hypothetical protein
MKCLYYLSPNLDISKKVSDDLHEAGQLDWYLHVISKDEHGLAQKHIHSSNYLETLDLFRGTTVGGLIGLALSSIAVMIALYTQYFGPDLPNVAYFMFIGFFTMFGIWEGGLYGIDSENQKIQPFHDDIKNGKYLVLVYIDKTQEDAIRSMMNVKHPESKLVGVDRHFINPFTKVRVV